MLTDSDIRSLADRMAVPLVFCDFKDNLKKTKLQYNKSYIINMENEFDDDGTPNKGSHYTGFQVNKYANGKIEPIYFDSYGQPPPEIVMEFCGNPPHNSKDIQSLLNSACGWYCLAFLHYINSYEKRTRDLYTDANHFIDLFEDLEKTNDKMAHLKNEWILKHFFRSVDPSKRKPIEIAGIGAGKMPNPDEIIKQDKDYTISKR
jgi:hypothetical protein